VVADALPDGGTIASVLADDGMAIDGVVTKRATEEVPELSPAANRSEHAADTR
jgi:hypothetical protein